MKKLVLLLLSLGSVVLLFSPHRIAHSSTPRRSRPLYAPNQVLVQLKNGMKTGHLGPRAVAEQIFPSHVAGSRPVESTGAPGLYQIDLDRSMSVEQAVSQAKNDPRVDFAEPNYYYYPAETVPNDTLFFQEWDMANSGSQPPGGKAGADIEATRAWDITTGSDNVVAAVIDTGVDLSNPDLAPNAWINPSTDDGTGLPNDINGWNFLSNNNLVFDPNTDVGGDRGHGTHVAGTIGAVGDNGMLVAGVAWHVKIMVLKFLGLQSDGSVGGSTADAIKSINFVIAQKKLGINVRVINASWAGPNPSQGLRRAIVRAGKAGILFVCAAGNSGIGLNMDDPVNADYPGAWNDISTLISVAATDNSDNLAEFSNFGHATVTVAAPGVGIFSTFPGPPFFTIMSGTSMASPHVAGIAVLLAAHEPDLTAPQIKQRITATSVPLVSLGSMVMSSGRVDAFNALTNQIPAAGSPQISAVSTTKKFVTLDGINFVNGASVIQVNGAALPQTRYDTTYSTANGAVTRISSKLGKAGINSVFPVGTAVSVTVTNTVTGETSPVFPFTR